MSTKYRLLVLILALGVGLDQLTKAAVCEALPRHGVIPVIPQFFNLVHIHNRGAAFGLLSTWSASFASIFFILTTLVVLAVLSYMFWRLPNTDRLAATGYSLIMAGALGNLIDRLRLGEVVDFLDFYLGRHHWPAFNIADSLICIGVGLLFLAIWQTEKQADASHPI